MQPNPLPVKHMQKETIVDEKRASWLDGNMAIAHT